MPRRARAPDGAGGGTPGRGARRRSRPQPAVWRASLPCGSGKRSPPGRRRGPAPRYGVGATDRGDARARSTVPSAVRLSVIIVAYGGDLAPTLDALAAQRRPGDEIVVVDNLARAGGTAGVADHPAVDRLLRPSGNLHYADGAN